MNYIPSTITEVMTVTIVPGPRDLGRVPFEKMNYGLSNLHTCDVDRFTISTPPPFVSLDSRLFGYVYEEFNLWL